MLLFTPTIPCHGTYSCIQITHALLHRLWVTAGHAKLLHMTKQLHLRLNCVKRSCKQTVPSSRSNLTRWGHLHSSRVLSEAPLGAASTHVHAAYHMCLDHVCKPNAVNAAFPGKLASYSMICNELACTNQKCTLQMCTCSGRFR